MALGLAVVDPLAARAETELNGDVRTYLFGILEDATTSRRHAELVVLRLKLQSFLTEDLRIVAHGVVGLSSPPELLRTDIVSAEPRRFFDLRTVFLDKDDVVGVAELDRLHLRWDRPTFRLVAGRQPITWGVNYFWPTLDLFAPFTPQQIDRDYKAGVDALRLTVPTGDFSEVDLVFAGQGQDFPDDFSLAGLGRLHAGQTDFGFMGGRFHTDVVAGAFVTTDVAGMGIRGEVAFTRSGDERDRELGRERFVRASAGVDRRLTTTLVLSAELAWNGYGSDDPAGYPDLIVADRVLRGEIISLARRYGGLSLSWQASPLWSVGGAVLVNADDGSLLLQPVASWSFTDSVSLLFGAIMGLGPGSATSVELESEYGVVPATLWVAGKWYF